MRFTAPFWLFLLLVLPWVAWLGWPGRGPARKRETTSLVVRLLILACLILSMAGFETVRTASKLAVVFLLDVSDSVSRQARTTALEYVRQSMTKMGPDDQSALIVFAGDALVERPMSPGRELGSLASHPFAGQTDLAEAIRLGMTLFPPDAARRMVILSDGASTTGDPQTAAELAANNGVQLITVPIGSPPSAEVLVQSVHAPEYLQQGERFDLQFGVSATGKTQATVRVLEDGKLIFEGQQEFKGGEQTFSLPLEAGKTGFTRYQVQIEPQTDTWYQNNSLSTFSQVAGPPRVLIVAPTPGELMRGGQARPNEYTQIEQALKQANFAVDWVTPGRLASDLVDLAPYASVVLVDVPARQLSHNQMTTLQSYVRDLGGGLLAIGGPTSYGVGGYYKTPLEEILPVKMQITDQKRRPALAMVFIIDHSGSMSETSGGVEKVELAKEAAIRSVELLFPTDRVGVITFDETSAWAVPMTDLSDLGRVQNAIGSVRSGGGTDILGGMIAMSRVLPGDPAEVKHVILLTDGGADPAGIPELVTQMRDQYGITLSVVGVGNDVAAFLPGLAQTGGGNYYFVNDASTIPSIFTEETTLATRSYIEERTFFPQQANPSPILSGIQSLPQLQGYVATSIKNTARAILVSDIKDPILATWQYGLGRSVAFTSDATGRWAKDWLSWPGFAGFWAQAVRYTMRDHTPSNLTVAIQPQGEQAQVVVDAQANAGNSATGGEYLNGYQMQAQVIAPDGATQSVALQQVAPGKYAGAFTPSASGAYLFNVSGNPPEANGTSQQPVSERAGWSFAYSPEYSSLKGDRRALERIAALSNSKPLSLEAQGAEIFQHNLVSARTHHPAWPWLLALACLLLPFDIAIRRLLIGPADIRRALNWASARLSRRPKAAEAQVTSHVSALLTIKQRPEPEEPVEVQTYPLAPELKPAQQIPVDPTPQPSAPEPERPAPVEKPAAAPGASTTTVSSLLAGKRDRKKE